MQDDGALDEKFIQCNNCGIVHRIYDINKSDIIDKKDELASYLDIEDIKTSLYEDLSNVLEKYKVDLPTWEETKYKLENNMWNSTIILNKEYINDKVQGKYLILLNGNKYKIESYIRDNFITI